MQQILAGLNELNERVHKMPTPEQPLNDKLMRYSRNSYDRKLE